MNFTGWENYGLRAMLNITAHSAKGCTQASEIAQRQRIPPQYLQHVLTALRVEELIIGTRGQNGGYRLARPAESITAGCIFQALSGPLLPPELLLTDTIGTPKAQAVQQLWQAMYDALQTVSDGTTLQDLLHTKDT
ncbi:MAG: Rrf2 family transcriptional regulator [Armatimonas sp.]